MTHDDYLKLPGVNWSTLSLLSAVSPKWLRYRSAHPREDSPALLLGRAIHCCALEPERWARDYAPRDTPPKPRKPRRPAATSSHVARNNYASAIALYETTYAAWEAEHGGDEALTADQHALAERCAAAITAHPRAMEVLAHTRREEPFQWVDEETGIACKARGDALAREHITDLKSTRRQTLRAFYRDAGEWLYHGQLAYNHDGAQAAGRLSPIAHRPYMVAVQTVEPYDCAVIQLSPPDMAAGRALYRDALRRYAGCVAADWWPGIAPEVVQSELPPWAPGMNLPAPAPDDDDNGGEW